MGTYTEKENTPKAHDKVVDVDLWVRPIVQWFSKQMEKKLKLRDYRGGWEDCTFQYLISRLRHETDELLFEHFRHRIDTSTEKPISEKIKQKIITEAADVANFAMMIASKYK